MTRVLERVERILRLSLRGGDTADQAEARELLAKLEITRQPAKASQPIRYARREKKGGK
jgi:hypothetical protein